MRLNIVRCYCYRILATLLYIAPLAVLFGINIDAYLVSPSATLGFFGYLLAIIILFGAKDKILDCAQKDTMLTVFVIIFVIAFIMRFLADQLLLISFFGLLGCLASIVPSKVADEFQKEKGKHTLGYRTAWRRAFGIPEKGGGGKQ